MVLVELLNRGEVIGFPTDTVYGIGAAFSQICGIQKIFTIKNRSIKKPLIAHVSSFEMALSLIDAPTEEFFLLAKAYWPGPLTLVVKKAAHVPDLITAGLPTIGIRIPDCKATCDLIEQLGEPLIGTSANHSGEESLFSDSEAKELFGDTLAGYLKGSATLKSPSTVYSICSKKVLREGFVQF